jgi:hypothetical protein
MLVMLMESSEYDNTVVLIICELTYVYVCKLKQITLHTKHYMSNTILHVIYYMSNTICQYYISNQLFLLKTLMPDLAMKSSQ